MTHKKSSANPHSPRLGNKDLIRLICLSPDKRQGGKLTAVFDSGMVFQTGRPRLVIRRTGVTTIAEAQPTVDRTLAELTQAWVQKAGDILAIPEAPSVPLGNPLKQLTISEVLDAVLAGMKARQTHRASYGGYELAARHFLRASGPLATVEGHRYTEADCVRIKKVMLEPSNYSSKGHHQLLRNLRYLLRHADVFPEELIPIFEAPMRPKDSNSNRPVPFSPEERQTLLLHLDQTDWTTRGLCLLGANFSVLVGDAATATWAQLDAAQRAGRKVKRDKTGSQFNADIWDLTKAWTNEQRRDPDAVYIFPQLVFSSQELLENPRANQVALAEDQLSLWHRKYKAARRAMQLFAFFLRRCGISRSGVSFRSFRQTKIAAWEENRN